MPSLGTHGQPRWLSTPARGLRNRPCFVRGGAAAVLRNTCLLSFGKRPTSGRDGEAVVIAVGEGSETPRPVGCPQQHISPDPPRPEPAAEAHKLTM